MVGLLANDVHCSLNCDNATYYSSTLSHDFYQLLISSEYMSIMSWKVIAGWSIQHSLMPPDEKRGVWRRFEADWNAFCNWILTAHPTENAAWAADNPVLAQREITYRAAPPQFPNPNKCQAWKRNLDQCRNGPISAVTEDFWDNTRCKNHQPPYAEPGPV